MSVNSYSADALVKKAEECFELGLISQETLERVTMRAQTNPEYDAILDLPFDWQIAAERSMRRRAARRSLMHRLLRR